MKVSLKTVTGVSFQLDLEESVTIAETKARIADSQGANFPKDRQVLIYKGQVLKDETTLKDNNITEDGFMVVTVLKGKAAPAASPAAPKPPKEEPKPAETAAPSPAKKEEAEAQPAEGSSPLHYQNSASNLAMGSALESSIQQICDMGFEKELVVKAMRAAYNNPDRAVEYLMSGIPEQPQPQASPAPPAAAAAAAAAGGEGGDGGSGPNTQPLNMFDDGTGGESELSFLRGNPQFQALRQMVQANPQILQPMLQELGKQNPQLLGLINRNQGEFLRLLNSPEAGGAAGAGPEVGGGGMTGAPGEHVVSVTPEEQAAIDRPEALGFERALCIEAFLACDRDEALAANYLLENGED